MTVCVASLCQVEPGHFMVVGATDMKVTTYDTQYQPPLPKIRPLGVGHGFAIVALIAGDMAAQDEICGAVVSEGPQFVRYAVDRYCAQLGAHNRQQAENRVLYPLGLDMRSYLSDASHLEARFHSKLAREIGEIRAKVQTVVCGVDATGANIYTISSASDTTRETLAGFAAVGEGYWHAQSQFMFAKHTPFRPLARTLMLTFLAKKRAEAAAGVGKRTAMFYITPEGVFKYVDESVIEQLKLAYRRMRNAQGKALKKSYAAIESYFEESIKQGREEPPTPEPPKPDDENKSPSNGAS